MNPSSRVGRGLAWMAVAATVAACSATTPILASAAATPGGPLLLSGGTIGPIASFLDLAGSTHTVAEFKGRDVLLVVFAYWCPHCQADMPLVAQFVGAHPGLDFVPVEGSGGTESEVAAFQSQYGLTGSVYYDPTNKVLGELAVTAYPTALLIGQDGSLINETVGLPPFDLYALMFGAG